MQSDDEGGGVEEFGDGGCVREPAGVVDVEGHVCVGDFVDVGEAGGGEAAGGVGLARGWRGVG